MTVTITGRPVQHEEGLDHLHGELHIEDGLHKVGPNDSDWQQHLRRRRLNETEYHFSLILSDLFENLLVAFLVSQQLDHKYLFIWTESAQIVQEEGVQKLGHLHHHRWSSGGHHYARIHRVPVMLLVTCYSLLTQTTKADIHEVRS